MVGCLKMSDSELRFHRQLMVDSFRFIKIKGRTKEPVETNWNTTNIYAWNDPSLEAHIKKGNNYGVLGGYGDLLVIDADREPLISNVRRALPKTFTTQTPHGGNHFYYTCRESKEPIRLWDVIIEANKGRENIGDVQGQGKQVIGAGSYIEEAGETKHYRVVEDSPIAEVKREEVLRALSSFIVMTTTKTKSYDDAKFGEITGVKSILDVINGVENLVQDSTDEYYGAHPMHGSKGGKNFWVNSYNSVWHCFRHGTGGGILQWIAVQEGILRCEECTKGALAGNTFRDVLKVAREKYGIELKRKPNDRLQAAEYYLSFKEKRDGTEEVAGVKHKLFADDLIAIYHFKTLRDTEEVIYYEDGYYHYEGEAIIRAKSENTFGEYINTYHVNEILNHIRRSTYIERKKLNKDLWTLNLENGLFNIKTFEFTPHTPDLLTTIRMPIKYNPTAICPATEKFISEIVYPEHVKLIKEMIGYCLYHDYTYQNWFLLHGEGENGKSKLLSLIGRFLGEENISSIGLQELEQRFAAVNLYGKSANVVADLSDADLKRTARLKQLTGGDLITAEPKFKNAFTYFNFAKLIYSCNKVPLTEDKTRAFFRRVIFIPFPNTFVIGKNADEHILDKLTTEEELSGLLNVAIDGLKHITGNGGFSGYLTPEENEDLYERASNPVYGFFYDWCEVDVEKYVVKTELVDTFCEYCKEKKLVAYSEKKFIQEMKLLVRLEESRISVGKRRLRVWKGINIKDVHDVHDVHLFSLLKREEKNDSICVLGKENHGHAGQGGHNENYATCERCGKKAFLHENQGICVCPECLDELKEEEREKTNDGHCTLMDINVHSEPLLTCICGKQFDTVEVLRHHQANCAEFQHKQDMEARE